MAAITFEQWWESMEREPLTYSYEHAKEGWNAAIKSMEAVATSHNARDEIAALVAHYDNRNDTGSFMDYVHSRIEAMRQLSPVA